MQEAPGARQDWRRGLKPTSTLGGRYATGRAIPTWRSHAPSVDVDFQVHGRANVVLAAAGHGRNDRDLVAGLYVGLEALKEPHVLAVHVQVHEAADRPLVVPQALPD